MRALQEQGKGKQQPAYHRATRRAIPRYPTAPHSDWFDG